MNHPRWQTFGNVVDVSFMFTGVCVSVVVPICGAQCGNLIYV